MEAIFYTLLAILFTYILYLGALSIRKQLSHWNDIEEIPKEIGEL